MGKFVCITPCWHNGHNFHLGDTVDASVDQLPKGKNGELRHFRSLGPDPVPEKRGTEVKVNSRSRKMEQ